MVFQETNKISLIVLFFVHCILFTVQTNASIVGDHFLGNNSSDSTRIHNLLKKSDELMSSSPIDALKMATEANTLASEETDKKILLKTKMQLGKILFYKGLYENASKLYIEMYSLAQEIKNPEWMGKSLYQLGSIRLVLEDYQEALNYFNKAKDILDLHYQNKGGLNKAIQSGFHNNFGVVFSGLQAYDKAVLEFI